MSTECTFWNDFLPTLRKMFWTDQSQESVQCDITSPFEPNGASSNYFIQINFIILRCLFGYYIAITLLLMCN